MSDHVVVYRDDRGEWRWVRIAANNERVSASTEGYVNKAHATNQARDLNPDCEVEVPEA